MAHTVYLTGLQPGGGKSTVALGVTELLSRQVQRIGVFRPLVRTDPDPIVELLRRRYHLPVSGTGTTYAEAARLIGSGRVDELISMIVERFWELDERCDAAVVIGTDFGRENGAGQEQSGLPDELAVNVRLANEMRATTLPIVDGAGRTAEQVAEEIRTAYHVLTDLNATLVAIVANRVVPDGRAHALGLIGQLAVPVYAIPTVPTVYAPTVDQVAEALSAIPLLDGEGDYTRDALEFVVGGATVSTFLEYLVDGALVITPGDRADVIISAYAAHVAGQVSLAGMLLTLGKVPDPQVLTLLRQMGTPLPLISVPIDSFEAVSRVASLEGRIDAENPRKVQAALGAFESHVDTAELADRLNLTRSARITPMMFEYELISRARSLHRHVVLPEGTEERILRAAEILLRRKVCEITLVGPAEEISRRSRELGLDVTGAHIVDPVTSPWREEFAQTYLRLRGRKGVTMEYACDRISDVNYFGTMMVHTGRADAMVSGSAHPTANTIRPAFEIIRTLPGVSVASSVFFMCLPDRVLVYGDCAVNPEPTPEQLADIAISSAGTAAQFGLAPRVAMLSYSTGSSGHGADVEKVAAATALVRERRPDLPVEGPIQYDAAIDPSVAATKLPGSAVAGRATVFIFPDLNTGNNTYKAVQRSANAVAVGPVLQGLRKPVNDLSRGATVRDIVNTVAITAIQAASGTGAAGAAIAASGAGAAGPGGEEAVAVHPPAPGIAGGPGTGPGTGPDGGASGAGGPDGARPAARGAAGGPAVAS